MILTASNEFFQVIQYFVFRNHSKSKKVTNNLKFFQHGHEKQTKSDSLIFYDKFEETQFFISFKLTTSRSPSSGWYASTGSDQILVGCGVGFLELVWRCVDGFHILLKIPVFCLTAVHTCLKISVLSFISALYLFSV